MSIFMIIRIAVKALGRNKVRTTLTMLGMIIGVGSVIAMVALGTGAQATIEEQVKSTGTNMITISQGSQNTGGVRTGTGNSTRLTEDDAKMLRALPEVQYLSEGTSTRQQVIYGNQNWQTSIQGVNTDFPTIRSWDTMYGSFFSESDVTGATKVAVLGASVADKLFGEGIDPTDEVVRIRNHVFRVLGVLSRKGTSASGQDQDDTVVIPYKTSMRKLQAQTFLNSIIVGARTADEVDATSTAISTELRIAHKLPPDGSADDFTVRTLNDLIALRTQTAQTMTALMGAVASVSLLVGGIGIMNIMLVSVTERTREIGLRMAIGARGFDVLLQFLVEAIVISMFGGGIGIALGWISSEGVKYFMQMPALVPINAVFIAVGFAALVGVFFGFYPAWKAAGLDPIEALRFE